MNNAKKNIIIIYVVIFGMIFSSASVLAESTYTISLDPAEPEKESTIIFTANITSTEDIDIVELAFQECKPGLCFLKEYYPMTLSGDDYTCQVTLTNEEATYIQYWLKITTESGVNETDIPTKLNLTESSTNGDDNNTDDNNNDDNKKVPGFELFAVIISIFIGVIILKRKRFR